MEKFSIGQRLGTNQIQDAQRPGCHSDGPGNSGEHVSLGNGLDADRTTAHERQERGTGHPAQLRRRRTLRPKDHRNPEDGTGTASLLHDGLGHAFRTQVLIRRGRIGAGKAQIHTRLDTGRGGRFDQSPGGFDIGLQQRFPAAWQQGTGQMDRHIRPRNSTPQCLRLAIIDDDHLRSEGMQGPGPCWAAHQGSQVYSSQRCTLAEVPDQGCPYGTISACDDDVH